MPLSKRAVQNCDCHITLQIGLLILQSQDPVFGRNNRFNWQYAGDGFLPVQENLTNFDWRARVKPRGVALRLLAG